MYPDYQIGLAVFGVSGHYGDIAAGAVAYPDNDLGLAGIISQRRSSPVQSVSQCMVEGVYCPTDVDCLRHSTTMPQTLLRCYLPM